MAALPNKLIQRAMRLSLVYTFTSIMLMNLGINEVCAQSENKKYISILAEIGFGFSHPIENPTKFPIVYSDAQLFPSDQAPKLGYECSLSCLFPISKSLTFGLNSYVSEYSFTEVGEQLFFWTNSYEPYSIQRKFKMYGVGLLVGCSIFVNNNEKLQTYAGVNYVDFLSTENVFIWSEQDNRTKIMSSLSIEYARLLAENLFLACGIHVSTGLNNFYESIPYKPFTYGVQVGLEKRIAWE